MAFDLKSIQKGAQQRPPRLFVYGAEGIGKSTFGASAPSPIFIQTEDGLGTLDAARFPLAESVDHVREAIGTLYNEKHDFSTVVLDSADWLEQLVVKEVESKYDAKELAYGKAAIKQAEIWQELLGGLNALRNDRDMAVIVLGHMQIKRFDSPEVEPFDRYQPKLQERSNALVREWADGVLFANYKTVVKKADVGFNKEIARGITTGERLLHTNDKPAHMAKNRYGLPDTVPMDWNALMNAMAGRAEAQPKAA